MYGLIDSLRRRYGETLDALGFGPEETPHRVLAEWPGARVRAYGGTGPPVLIVQAPFKRAYIWDIAPETSAVRRMLESGRAVYLLEWLDVAPGQDFGLAEYAHAWPIAALTAIASETGGAPAVLAGHSLGGTFAAILAALEPDTVAALWLLDAPLAFEDAGGRLTRLLKLMRPEQVAPGAAVPGSFISEISAAALPEDFTWRRMADLGASFASREALRLHLRAMRWTLDEFALPRRLFGEVLDDLYRRDRFLAGDLPVGGRRAALAGVRAPVTAVVNTASEVVPPASLTRGLEAATLPSPPRTLVFGGDVGCAIQHLGPLISRRAHAEIWPQILA